MDPTTRAKPINPLPGEPVVVTGAGSVLHSGQPEPDADTRLVFFDAYTLPIESTVDCREWLRTRKTRKFMGKQDQLAVIAAGRALRHAGLLENADHSPGDRTGLYLVTGYIPFERTDIETLAVHSIEQNRFSMQRFGAEAIHEVNPLLTFRCLPNMPAFHVSLNFQLTGEYYVAYPDTGQWYLALEQAVLDLQSGKVDVALIGSVADQNNFLVHHLKQRLALGNAVDDLDVSSFLVLEKAESAAGRNVTPLAKLMEYRIEYLPFDPFLDPELIQHRSDESLLFGTKAMTMKTQPFAAAAASLALEALCTAQPASGGDDLFEHEVTGLQQFDAYSQWQLYCDRSQRGANEQPR